MSDGSTRKRKTVSNSVNSEAKRARTPIVQGPRIPEAPWDGGQHWEMWVKAHLSDSYDQLRDFDNYTDIDVFARDEDDLAPTLNVDTDLSGVEDEDPDDIFNEIFNRKLVENRRTTVDKLEDASLRAATHSEMIRNMSEDDWRNKRADEIPALNRSWGWDSRMMIHRWIEKYRQWHGSVTAEGNTLKIDGDDNVYDLEFSNDSSLTSSWSDDDNIAPDDDNDNDDDEMPDLVDTEKEHHQIPINEQFDIAEADEQGFSDYMRGKWNERPIMSYSKGTTSSGKPIRLCDVLEIEALGRRSRKRREIGLPGIVKAEITADILGILANDFIEVSNFPTIEDYEEESRVREGRFRQMLKLRGFTEAEINAAIRVILRRED
jgi:hypothetical protein